MRLEFQSPGACNGAFCSTRGVLPGQAAGSLGAILQTVYEQVRLPNLSHLLVSPLRAVSGQDRAPVYPSRILAALFPLALSQAADGNLANFPKRTLSQRAYRLLVEFRKQASRRLFVSLCVLSSLPSVHGFNHGGREIGNVRKSVGEIRNVQC